MKDYAVGAIVGGLLALALAARSFSATSAAIVRASPRAPATAPVLGASALATATLATPAAPMPRGVPPALAEAIRRAPARPDPRADRATDVPVLTLSPETAAAHAAAAVARVPGLIVTAADTATSMRSGVRRVVFTAHAPAVPMSLKLVATFVQRGDTWELVGLRPYSAVPDILDPLAGADMAAATYACFLPVVTPGPCAS